MLVTAFTLGLLAVQWVANSTRARKTGCGRRDEGRRVDSRHPDSGFVDLEKIGYQRIKVDVRIGKVVECEFLPIPEILLEPMNHESQIRGQLTFGTRHREFPC